MDPKKKRLYLVAVILCVGIAAGILIWSNSYAPAEESLVAPVNPTGSNTAPVVSRSASGEATYSPPAVFPQNTTFDSSIVSQLKIFQTFQPSQVAEAELGRQNPFNNY